MGQLPKTILLAVLALAATALPCCAQNMATGERPTYSTASEGPQFEHGRPRKVVDAVGWVFGIPAKIILWDRRAANHCVSPAIEEELAEYLMVNGLLSTKVRINQYDPVGEWRRLAANKEVGAGWRYTVGAFGTLGYTLFPGRLFGGDKYNPYTDSIYVYSDIPCIAQEQAAYSKLVHARTHPGTYAAFTSLPIVQLWPAKQAKSDVLDYTLAGGTLEQQREATHVLYAKYGAQVGGQASVFFGAGIPFTLAGAGIGHVAARSGTTELTRLPPVEPTADLPTSEVAVTPSEAIVR